METKEKQDNPLNATYKGLPIEVLATTFLTVEDNKEDISIAIKKAILSSLKEVPDEKILGAIKNLEYITSNLLIDNSKNNEKELYDYISHMNKTIRWLESYRKNKEYIGRL